MAKHKINVPFFEIGPKSYLYGDDVLELALAADVALADAYVLITDSDTGEVYDAFDLTGPVTAYLLTEKGNYTVTAHSRAFDGEGTRYVILHPRSLQTRAALELDPLDAVKVALRIEPVAAEEDLLHV